MVDMARKNRFLEQIEQNQPYRNVDINSATAYFLKKVLDIIMFKGGGRLAPPCPKLAKVRPVVTMGDISLGNRSGSDSLFQESTKKESTAT